MNTIKMISYIEIKYLFIYLLRLNMYKYIFINYIPRKLVFYVSIKFIFPLQIYRIKLKSK